MRSDALPRATLPTAYRWNPPEAPAPSDWRIEPYVRGRERERENVHRRERVTDVRTRERPAERYRTMELASLYARSVTAEGGRPLAPQPLKWKASSTT